MMDSVSLGRCVQLNGGLKRCPKLALYAGTYHGDSEIYHNLSDEDVSAVQVCLCEHHAKMARILPEKKKERKKNSNDMCVQPNFPPHEIGTGKDCMVCAGFALGYSGSKKGRQ